ncbi:MAG: tetratricopeptide repeat protein [Candidatus Krumholzibacteria bacterium]|nr:tetratricopeptide repeat protein [Candidatus Krumholzibacteria bacterium]
MSSAIGIWLAEAPWMELLALFIDITLKGAVICAIAGIATLLLRRSSASVRNLVWLFALVGLILLPALSLLTPVWNIPVIPELASWGAGSYTSEFEKPDPETSTGGPYAARIDATGADSPSGDSTAVGLPWYAWAIFTWIAGAVIYLVWRMVSHAGVRFVVNQAHPARDEWTLLSGGVVEELNLRRKVRLLESDRIIAAITVGVFDPVIVLPSDSNDWTESRRRLVLYHELAHVKRWDALTETVALVATVVHWFNPLVWHAVKQLRIERETDCDNAVLRTGAKPSDYAELLMNIAADLGTSAKPVWQLTTISQSSNVKDRLMNILNQKINRNKGSRRSAVLTGVLVLALVLPVSSASLWSPPSTQTEDKAQQEEKVKSDEMKTSDEMKKKEQQKTKMSAAEKSEKMWQQVCANENSAACKVGTIMKKKGVETGVEAYYKMKKADDGEYVFKEKEFNALGYVFLYHEKTDAAIAVFELNVKAYPESWNVYDSLGEAYMVAKRYDESIKYYETALKLNPDSKHSQHQLQELRTMVSESS